MNSFDHKLIFDGVFGSKLYGTDTPNSDLDYKAIFLPKPREIILGNGISHFSNNTGNSETKNTSSDVDREYYSLKYFIDLAIKGETIAIDMVHTPSRLNLVSENHVWDFIKQNRHRFYTTNMKAYLGYVKKQAHKYGIKGSRLSALRTVKEWADALPNTRPVTFNPNQHMKNVSWVDGVMHQETKIGEFFDSAPIVAEHAFFEKVNGSVYFKVLSSAYQETLSVQRFKMNIARAWNSYGERARLAEMNQGIDWKAVHHACRGGFQLLEIYKTGDLQYPLKQRECLMQIKNGDLDFKHVSELLDTIVSEVELAAQEASKNGMPDKVDTNFWYDFVHDVYYDEVHRSKFV